MKPDQYRLMFEVENSHWWFLAKRKFISTQLPKTNPNWKILDLGCGTGGLSQYLENWGEVTRIEKSPEAIKFLNKRNLKFIPQDINNLSIKNNYYDLICLFDVLYHKNIKDDNEVIKNIYTKLKKDGILLITDSAVPWLFSHHDLDNMARKRYYLSELNRKLTLSGYKIIKQSYIYFFVFPFFLVIRFIGKFIQFEDVGEVNPLINYLFKKINSLEALLLPYINFPFGSSIIIKAVK
jgi:SAM-dependent methyltransferase